MKKEKKRILLSAVSVAGAGITFLLWLVELMCGGWSVPGACGAVAAFAALSAGVALIAGGKKELTSIEQVREQTLEKVRDAEEKMQQEMEQFRSTLSHSLRMPVSIIQGYADLLTDGMVDDPEVQKEYLGKISARAQYMSDVIRRQRIGGEGLNRNKLVFDSVDLLKLVEQVVRDMKTAAEEAEVQLQVLSSERELVVTADSYLLNRVFYNLLENSMKYMGRPGRITIRLARQKDTVVVQVQDDGLGMESGEVEHIFEKNYQGSNRVSGQGFGLFLVKESVEAHGGSVSAKSAPGQGMGITLHIPSKG